MTKYRQRTCWTWQVKVFNEVGRKLKQIIYSLPLDAARVSPCLGLDDELVAPRLAPAHLDWLPPLQGVRHSPVDVTAPGLGHRLAHIL